ncbi:ABC transporter permease subunit [Haloarcula marina]|uniref:ABC transporter permease subunit n=1 Tax=Haloarcula marina TaxID=2961574 RepID=UPI0020B85736|nr:ABC transporter permease subunit [Halomicroarcula marina]
MSRIAKRLLQSVFTIWAVITITFVLIRQMPGGPMGYLRAQLAKSGIDPGSISNLGEWYFTVDFDAPLHVQYINYLTGILQGDLGRSIILKEPVTDVMLGALPWTLFVMSFSILFSYIIGLLVGALMAYLEGSKLDYVGTIIGVVFNSVPYYVFALALLFVFAFQGGWFPTGGRVSLGVEPGFTLEFLLDAFHHAALPIFSFVFTAWGGIALAMRGNAISVLGSDYLRVARLRGLSSKRIASRYVLRNAVLPMYTKLLLSIGFLFGGAVILEQIFTYLGVGFYMFRAIQANDFPLLMGGFLFISVAVVLAVLIADMTYSIIDPRAASDEGSQKEQTLLESIREAVKWVRRRRKTGASVQMESRQVEDNEESVFTARSSNTVDDGTIQTIRKRLHVLPASFAILWSDIRARVGLLIIGAFVFLGTVGLLVIPQPEIGQAPRLLTPFENMAYPLGTNNQGQRMSSLLVYSIPPIFKMILAGAVFATTIATVVGTVAGYLGGFFDRALMTLADIQIALPGLPLVIVLAALFQPESPYVLGLIISVDKWGGLARGLRSEVLTLRGLPYVESNRIIGVSTPKILFSDILPNVMSYISINFAYQARSIIFQSVGLYFLGVLSVTYQNWGITMNIAYNQGALNSPEQFYWLLEPMMMIVLLTLGMVLLAQGMDRVFNPRIRARHLDSDSGSQSEPESSAESKVSVE